jgi:hypothetical protein
MLFIFKNIFNFFQLKIINLLMFIKLIFYIKIDIIQLKII